MGVAIKLGISAALIWYALAGIDAANALRLLKSVPPGIVVVALGILALQQFFGGLRLHRLLALVKTPISVTLAVDVVFVGLFFGTTLISFISGDAMRMWRLANSRVPVRSAFQAVFFDRMLGLVTLIALIAMGAPLLLLRIGANRPLLLSVLLGVLIGILGTLAFLLFSRVPRTLRRWRPIRVMSDSSSVALSIITQRQNVLYLLVVSLLLQLLNVLGVFVIAEGLGVDVSLINLMVLVPPVILLTMLPLSYAGWGMRESAMVVVFGLLGVSPEHSVAISVCFGLCMTTAGLPGGVIWLLARRGVEAPPEYSAMA